MPPKAKDVNGFDDLFKEGAVTAPGFQVKSKAAPVDLFGLTKLNFAVTGKGSPPAAYWLHPMGKDAWKPGLGFSPNGWDGAVSCKFGVDLTDLLGVQMSVDKLDFKQHKKGGVIAETSYKFKADKNLSLGLNFMTCQVMMDNKGGKNGGFTGGFRYGPEYLTKVKGAYKLPDVTIDFDAAPSALIDPDDKSNNLRNKETKDDKTGDHKKFTSGGWKEPNFGLNFGFQPVPDVGLGLSLKTDAKFAKPKINAAVDFKTKEFAIGAGFEGLLPKNIGTEKIEMPPVNIKAQYTGLPDVAIGGMLELVMMESNKKNDSPDKVLKYPVSIGAE